MSKNSFPSAGKFQSKMNQKIVAKQLGTSLAEPVHGVAADSSGNVYMAGPGRRPGSAESSGGMGHGPSPRGNPGRQCRGPADALEQRRLPFHPPPRDQPSVL